jgi:hypothetical protein
MNLKKILKKLETENFKTNTDNNLETLYSNNLENNVIQGVEIPQSWMSLNNDELKARARLSILELSRSSNSDFKAKELGFNNAKHLMDLCFDFILK